MTDPQAPNVQLGSSAPQRPRAESVRVFMGSDATTRLQQFGRRVRRAEARRRGWARRIKAVVFAPLRAAREAAQAVRAFGAATRDDVGVSIARQFAWTWWLNVRHAYIAENVYRFRLFDRARAWPVPLFIQPQDAGALYRLVGWNASREAIGILADKRLFETWCVQQGLPSPPILMAFESGRITRNQLQPGQGPEMGLFGKWGSQYGGDATVGWDFRDGLFVDADGRCWHFDEVVQALAERSHAGSVLLQPRLRNHSALQHLSPNALSTIRIMTVRHPERDPAFLAAVLRMGTGKSLSDNVSQGGIASSIDVTCAALGPARRHDNYYRTEVFDHHPDTGARITGATVPFLKEAMQLALEAHHRLGSIACVGWDVAVLEDGPVLVEGNWNAGVEFVQLATQVPLLTTEFAATFAAWLDAPACKSDAESPCFEHFSWNPT